MHSDKQSPVHDLLTDIGLTDHKSTLVERILDNGPLLKKMREALDHQNLELALAQERQRNAEVRLAASRSTITELNMHLEYKENYINSQSKTIQRLRESERGTRYKLDETSTKLAALHDKYVEIKGDQQLFKAVKDTAAKFLEDAKNYEKRFVEATASR